MKPKEKKEHSEKSPEKKLPKSSGRGKQLARMSKEQLKAQVSHSLVVVNEKATGCKIDMAMPCENMS